MPRRAGAFMVEGYSADELLALPSVELEELALTGAPLVVRAGSAEVLASFAREGERLAVELAHVDRGGEGVLLRLTSLVRRWARREGFRRIRWIVYAANCVRPNPKLRRVLEHAGFTPGETERGGLAYHQSEELDAAGAGAPRASRRPPTGS